jgi:hypothetical protein
MPFPFLITFAIGRLNIMPNIGNTTRGFRKKGEERRRGEKILISNFQAIFAKNHFILYFNFRIFGL